MAPSASMVEAAPIASRGPLRSPLTRPPPRPNPARSSADAPHARRQCPQRERPLRRPEPREELVAERLLPLGFERAAKRAGGADPEGQRVPQGVQAAVSRLDHERPGLNVPQARPPPEVVQF